MTDSVSVFMPLDPTMTMQEYMACNFPFKASKHLDQDDFLPIAEDGVPKPPDQRRPYQKFFKVNAITGAGFRARAQWADYNYPGGISGYEVEINVPTCLIGHNVLIDRSVSRAMELAVLQMQLFLLSRVKHPRGVYAIDVDSAILLNTTITNSYKHGSKAEAHQGRRNYQARTELFNHANKRNRYAKNEKLPATTFGPSGAGTSYLKGRDGDQVSYVKDRDAPSEGVSEFLCARRLNVS